MKKLFLILFVTCLALVACDVSDKPSGDGKGEVSQKIATIEEQCENVKATILKLEITKSAISSTIASLNEQPAVRGEDNNGVKSMIAALEERIVALEQMIANLKEYAEGDLAGMEDWLAATFATMEMYNALATELATLKSVLEGIEGVSIEAIESALAASEKLMKQWVNERLAGYYTIAEVDAQISALMAAISANNEDINKSIAEVLQQLSELKDEVTKGYNQAISEAITQNNGVIDSKIA